MELEVVDGAAVSAPTESALHKTGGLVDHVHLYKISPNQLSSHRTYPLIKDWETKPSPTAIHEFG